MAWFIFGTVCAGIAGYQYGKLVGVNLMLQLGSKIYPNFKSKITQHIMDEDINK
jgi:hypothetical protein